MKNDHYFDKKTVSQEGYKLICLPYAGGGASYFNGLQKAMYGGIDVIAAQLPGRESRMAEKPLHSCRELAAAIADELSPHLKSGNFSVFGHSMGGIIGYELSCQLTEKGLCPDVCFISSTAIEEQVTQPPSLELDDDAFLERVAFFGGIDKDSEILKYPEFKSVYLNILRADFTVVESYVCGGKCLPCPIAALCGDSDPSETLDNMRKWEGYTSSHVIYRQFCGDHFYIEHSLDELCRFLVKTIRSARQKRA